MIRPTFYCCESCSANRDWGSYLGYPACCIEHFYSAERTTSSFDERQFGLRGTGFRICPQCLTSKSLSEIYLEIAGKRICPTPFPLTTADCPDLLSIDFVLTIVRMIEKILAENVQPLPALMTHYPKWKKRVADIKRKLAERRRRQQPLSKRQKQILMMGTSMKSLKLPSPVESMIVSRAKGAEVKDRYFRTDWPESRNGTFATDAWTTNKDYARRFDFSKQDELTNVMNRLKTTMPEADLAIIDIVYLPRN